MPGIKGLHVEIRFFTIRSLEDIDLYFDVGQTGCTLFGLILAYFHAVYCKAEVCSFIHSFIKNSYSPPLVMQPQETEFVIKHFNPIKINRNFHSHGLTIQ
jgi:hypothetical protein